MVVGAASALALSHSGVVVDTTAEGTARGNLIVQESNSYHGVRRAFVLNAILPYKRKDILYAQSIHTNGQIGAGAKTS